MFGAVRAVVIVALGALVFLPIPAANRSMDALFAQGRTTPALPESLYAVRARLEGVKAEIRADICSRGEWRPCLGGLCMPDTLVRRCK